MRDSVQLVFVRGAATLRAAWALLVLATVAGPSFIEPMPRAAIPVVAATVGWSAYVWMLSRQEGFPARRVAWLDAAVFIVMLLGEDSLVPDPLIGDGTSWVFAGASMSVIAASLLLSAPQALAVTVLMIAGYLAGVAAAGESMLRPDGPTTSFILLVQGLMGAAAVYALRRTARRADGALGREVSSERAVILERQKHQERDAQERLLHDKVRSTLWLIGDGHLLDLPGSALLRCEESLAALQGLRDGRIADELARSVTHALHSACSWAQSIGLDVQLKIRSQDLGPGKGDPDQALEAVPEIVCEALGEATSQALANVRAHAGTDAASVELIIGPGTVQIEVRDDGHGFEPSRIGADKRGVRVSIVGRMSQVGGSAVISSKPGRGTTVNLAWTAEPVPAPAAALGGASALRLYGTSTVRILVAAAIVFHGLSLFAALRLPGDYFHPLLPVVAWSVELAVGIALVAGLGHRRPPLLAVWLAVVLIVAVATLVALDCQPRGVLGFANWSFGDTVWPLAFATAYLPIRQVALAVAAHDAIQTTVIAAKLGHNLPDLLKLSAILLENAMVQFALAVVFSILLRTTSVTARAVWNTGINRARLYGEVLVRRARAIRAANIDQDVISLLESVSAGTLDPSDPATRRRFQAAGRRMRTEDALGGLKAHAADIAVIAQRAAAADVHLQIESPERFARFPAPTRRPLLAALAAVLTFASPGEALIGLHDGIDMTLLGRQDSEPKDQQDAYSMTIALSVRAADAAALEQELRSLQGSARDVLEFDYDIASENPPQPDTAWLWLAMAAR